MTDTPMHLQQYRLPGPGILLILLFAGLLGCNLHYDVDAVSPPTDAGDIGDVSDTCEAPSDQSLCDEADVDCGETEVTDKCGQSRSLSCGGCEGGQTCDNHRCVCAPESPEELCEAHSVDACGSLTVTDRCDETRDLNCGTCPDGSGCNRDNNQCTDCEVDCDGKCGFVPDGCGDFVDCSADPDGITCGADESCQDFGCVDGDCSPIEACEADECGQRLDECGALIDCDQSCGDDQQCIDNACICQPMTDSQLCDELASADSVECGPVSVTDQCGDERSIDCGDCPFDETCEDNQCSDEPGICADLDLDTNVDHCGQCESPCTTAEVCENGSCDTFSCVEDQGAVSGDCNPLTATDCDPDTEFCTLQLVFSGGPSHFETTCSDISEIGSASRGEGCSSPSDCEEGLFCVGWDSPDPRAQVCSQLCDRDTQQGCADDEFCTNPFFESGDSDDEADLDGLGFCTSRCAPDDSNPCPSGQRCTADPAFPDDSCTPNFRCLFNGGSSGKSTGDSCDRTELHDDGCPAGHACVPAGSTGQDSCVQTCKSDGDCTGADCINAASPWQMLRHCELS